MIVLLTPDTADVLEPDDCGRLHVATGLPPDAVDAALRATATGWLDETGTAHLDIATLGDRAQAASVGADWKIHWKAMLDHAVRKGWLSSDGRSVSAHVEHLP